MSSIAIHHDVAPAAAGRRRGHLVVARASKAVRAFSNLGEVSDQHPALPVAATLATEHGTRAQAHQFTHDSSADDHTLAAAGRLERRNPSGTSAPAVPAMTGRPQRATILGHLAWGACDVYPGRAHLVPEDEDFALCSTRLLRLPLQIVRRWQDRPHHLVVCPECAIAHLLDSFPARRFPYT